MNGYRETESGLLVPQPPVPDGMRAIFERVHDALVISDLIPPDEAGALYVGLDVALKHPEWARAVIDGLRAEATEEERREADVQVRAFVEACPMAFEHEPEAST